MSGLTSDVCMDIYRHYEALVKRVNVCDLGPVVREYNTLYGTNYTVGEFGSRVLRGDLERLVSRPNKL